MKFNSIDNLKTFSMNQRYHGRTQRGLMTTELLVAATLLVTILSVVFPLAVKSNRVRQDARHYRLALDELTNQMEALLFLEDSELGAAIEQLTPSEEISSVLPHPKLAAERIADEDGMRIVLSLSWDQLVPSQPVTLVGWIASSKAMGGDVP